MKAVMIIFLLALCIGSLMAQCPRCASTPDYVCGLAESSAIYKWFTNPCHLLGWNCGSDEKYKKVEKSLCQKDLGEPNENTF